jgi:hypothetical protein
MISLGFVGEIQPNHSIVGIRFYGNWIILPCLDMVNGAGKLMYLLMWHSRDHMSAPRWFYILQKKNLHPWPDPDPKPTTAAEATHKHRLAKDQAPIRKSRCDMPEMVIQWSGAGLLCVHRIKIGDWERRRSGLFTKKKERVGLLL